jgi:histone deacetylase 1/2
MKCSAGFQEGELYDLVDGKKDVGTPSESYGLERRDIYADRTSATLLYQRRIEDSMDLPVVEDKDLGMSYAYVTTYINELAIPDPMTYREAVEGSYKEQWLLAIAEELESLKVRGVLELIPVKGMNKTGKQIGSKFVFKVKMKHGVVDKFKCRLVARGFTQRPNIDYSETFSPVARMNTLRIFLKLSVDRNHHRISIDFKTAFLNATLNEELYLSPIEGMDCEAGFVYRLKKAIYGLKQAGRSWSTILTEFLTMQGLKQCVSDPCVFHGGDMMVIVYVDDVIISTLEKEAGDKLVREIQEVFEIGDIGPVDWYLGIAFDDRGTSMRLSQKDYVKKMLTKYQVDASYEEETPMSEKVKLLREKDDELFQEFDLKGKIGSLMYLSVCTRPDICYAVSAIARMSNHPSKTVCEAVNHLFAYLNKNSDIGLLIKKELKSELIIWSDSDYAGDLNDFKSTSGIVAFLGCLIICWYCSKQSTTAQSSTDAEAISMNFATKEVVWIRGFLGELGEQLKLPTLMKGDNMAAIMLSKNPMFHKRTKHIMVKISYLQEMVKTSVTIWEHIGTNENIADMFTKALNKSKFSDLMKKLQLDQSK